MPILYHASSEIVTQPEIRISKYTKDFSWGFYCTSNYEQAKKWAFRSSTSIINKYEYKQNPELHTVCFDGITDEWLDFIVHCRAGGTHSYDIVEGSMADDTIWDYVEDFISGAITREAFWVLIKFKYPTHQISFHTMQSLMCLTYKGSDLLVK